LKHPKPHQYKLNMADSKAKALKLKDDGNTCFKGGEFAKATKLYSDAILLDPENHILYANRAATYLAQRDFKAAQEDCIKCLTIEPKFVKAIIRLATAHRMQGNLQAAITIVARGLSTIKGDTKGKKAKKVAGFSELKRMSTELKEELSRSNQDKSSSRSALSEAMMSGGMTQELQELTAKRQQANMFIGKVAREKKIKEMDIRRNDITLRQLNEFGDENLNTYKAVGRMFVKQTLPALRVDLGKENEQFTEDLGNLNKKRIYYERVIKDSEKNMEEIIRRQKSN